jgi:zinc D-Ala-D-Ala dipeptidase
MKLTIQILYIIFFVLIFSCKSKDPVANEITLNQNKIEIIENKLEDLPKPNDSTFVNIKKISKNFVFDMKYATKDNFLKAKVYDCAECVLRYKTIKALIIASDTLRKIGYKIKFFDCYRPHDVQVKMWKIVPNAKYVANPAKGSIHNRGCAVDLTLVTLKGKELDMGTKFDFFGEQASQNYTNLAPNILKNRQLLKSIMKYANFDPIESEWWHYNLVDGRNESVSNFKWKCE